MLAGQVSPDLAGWRAEFERLDRCPWPGPRPLRSSDRSYLLVGRDQEKSYFRREVTTYRLILLTGLSGVGKTSLLEVGLVPELESAGFRVAFCRDWSGSAEQADPVAFLADKVHRAFGAKVADLPHGPSLFWTLNERLRDKCVLILDQFEELIRDAPALTGPLFRLLIDINQRTELRVVISFRSEYLHEMANLEAGVKAFTMSHVALKQIDPDAVREVIVSANQGDVVAIKPEAADMVASLWQIASDTQAPDAAARRTRVGLLHLQALLYVLAAAAEDGPVEVGHVKALQEQRDPLELFVHGLEMAVREKIKRCQAASRTVGLDHFLIEGTSRNLVDAVRHLSSAGYKLVRDARDLMSATVGGRLDMLTLALAEAAAGPREPPDGPLPDAQLNALLNVLLDTILPGLAPGGLDLLVSRRMTIAAGCDEAFLPAGKTWAERVHEGADPRSVDPRWVSCGPMFGLAPAAVLIEELRRFVFALEWLQASSLVRISTPGSGGAMVALIHDGFGAALERWAQGESVGPGFELTALTSPQGGSFNWKRAGTGEPWRELDGTAGRAILANLRWRGAWVRADFRQVMFANCDLRGTIFDECVFEGVIFVNCLLDGAMFTDCTIRGAAESATRWTTKQPTFIVSAGADLVAVMAHYRGSDIRGDQLLCQLPGLPAVPLREPGAAGALSLAQPDRGLVICGGRVSSLSVRSCRFAADGRFSVRHVAGSGFEVVEQPNGSFEFYGCALRHIEVSKRTAVPATQPDGDARLDEGELAVDLSGSSIVQAWLGPGLQGTMTLTDCMLVQVFNASPGIAATARNSLFHGVVGITLADDCAPMIPGEEAVPLAEILAAGDVMSRIQRMDYRRDPSVESREEEGSAVPITPSSVTS